ncbi:MAG: hypothetical protein IT453_17410 [Planctomycetes bacterium]|nr:hypothetical protein [Planctomycetota bacterium]
MKALARAAVVLVAVLIVVAAWLVRGEPAAFADPTSAREMRRIELLLATSTTYEHDQWLDERAPPLYFARLVAGAAQRWLATPGGDPALRGVDEADLERLAVRATTVSCSLYALGVGLLAYALGRGPKRAASALVVAVVVGVVAARVAAAVDVRVLGDALACGGFALAWSAARSNDVFDRVATGLVAGALLGVGLATAPEAGALVAATASALLAEALFGPKERAEPVLAVGLCALTVAGVLAFVQLASFGDLAGLARATLAKGVLGVAVVFLFVRKFGLKRRPSWLFGAGPSAWLVAFAPALAWCAWACSQWEVESTREWLSVGLALAGAALLVHGVLRVDARRGAACAALFLAALPGLGAANLLLPLVVAGVLTLAILREHARAAGRELHWAHGIAWAAICAAAFGLAPRGREQREEAALVAFLRELRTSTPSVGPWNHPSARPDARILCEPELGPAVAYHARRAPLASAQHGERETPPVRAARALLEGPTDGLVARLAVSGAEAALVGEAVRGRRYERAVGDAPAPDVLHALAAAELADGLVVVAEADEPRFVRLVRWEVSTPAAEARAAK